MLENTVLRLGTGFVVIQEKIFIWGKCMMKCIGEKCHDVCKFQVVIPPVPYVHKCTYRSTHGNMLMIVRLR